MFSSLPKSKAEAKEKKAPAYFTGKPCKRGHIAPRTSYNHSCYECLKITNPEYYSRNRPKLIQRRKDERKLNPEKTLVNEAKGRAIERNVPFSITAADISVPKFCPVFNIPLLVGSEHPKDNNPSIDRIIPNLGYVPGNVIVISARANRIKNNSTISELKQLYEFYSSLNH